jgi:hypothetical protein
MDIETKIALGFLICFVAGLIGGWYATWQTYHQDKKRQEAFNEGLQFALDKKEHCPHHRQKTQCSAKSSETSISSPSMNTSSDSAAICSLRHHPTNQPRMK